MRPFRQPERKGAHSGFDMRERSVQRMSAGATGRRRMTGRKRGCEMEQALLDGIAILAVQFRAAGDHPGRGSTSRLGGVRSGHPARERNRVRGRVHLLLRRGRRGLRILIGASARRESASKQYRNAQMSKAAL